MFLPSTHHRLARSLAVAAVGLACAVVAGCGGSSAGGNPAADSPSQGPPPDDNDPLAQRISAATATAASATNPCVAIRPFYWELGDRTARLAAGSVQADNALPVFTEDSIMSLASASKWIYGAYVAQLRQGALTDEDVKYLTFRSGYSNFSRCLPGQSVDGCVAYQNNGVHSILTDGKFSYGGGHMQKHASLNGLSALFNAGLAAEIRSRLGDELGLSYSQPQLAGGGVGTPAGYARFLRKVLDGSLRMGALLGSHAVCTNPDTCPPGEAVNTPVPPTESWHYSIGHWVEDDPVVGDGAYSSAGAFGFYPWIDVSKTWYGIVARIATDDNGMGFASTQCGRLIRKAWAVGVAQ